MDDRDTTLSSRFVSLRLIQTLFRWKVIKWLSLVGLAICILGYICINVYVAYWSVRDWKKYNPTGYQSTLRIWEQPYEPLPFWFQETRAGEELKTQFNELLKKHASNVLDSLRYEIRNGNNIKEIRSNGPQSLRIQNEILRPCDPILAELSEFTGNLFDFVSKGNPEENLAAVNFLSAWKRNFTGRCWN